MKTLYFFVWIILLLPVFCLGKEHEGPYYIITKQLARCRDNGEGKFIFPTRLNKYNRTHISYTGNVTTLFDIDEGITIRNIVVIKGTNGRWNSALLDYSGSACEIVNRFFKEIVRDMMTASGKSSDTPVCPLWKGTYVVKNYVPNFTKLQEVPFLPYGEYRFELVFQEGVAKRFNRLGCMCFYVEIRPRSELNKQRTAQIN